MPYLGPGLSNNVNVTPAPVQVFTPTPGAAASCRFANLGSGVVYVGGANVSPVNGFPIYPGNRPVTLPNVGVNLYACSGVGIVNAGNATLSAVTPAGTTSLTVATAAPTAGTYIRVGNGTGVEYLSVVSFTGSGTPWTATTSTATVYDHVTGATVATVAAVPGLLSVTAGVV
jgi:hypothetical protein